MQAELARKDIRIAGNWPGDDIRKLFEFVAKYWPRNLSVLLMLDEFDSLPETIQDELLIHLRSMYTTREGWGLGACRRDCGNEPGPARAGPRAPVRATNIAEIVDLGDFNIGRASGVPYGVRREVVGRGHHVRSTRLLRTWTR